MTLFVYNILISKEIFIYMGKYWMEKYIKVKLSLKDKLNLLFFDLIPERVCGILPREKMNQNYNKQSEDTEIIEESDDMDNIPFFDNIGDSETNF